ncbi:MAG: Ig-like domain-containing protein [Clostridia bacterium]|nr:Ig-like domain-containing protein [Clostridia bacterium]
MVIKRVYGVLCVLMAVVVCSTLCHAESEILKGNECLSRGSMLSEHSNITGEVYSVYVCEGDIRLFKTTAIGDKETIAEIEIGYQYEDDNVSLMSVSELTQSKDLIVAEATKIIIQNEGDYGTVNKNDNNHGMSIGKFQWNAFSGRALPLLQTIVKANPTNAQNILGDTLYYEIANNAADYWTHKNRTASDEEVRAISALLTTAEGKAAQNALIAVDSLAYIDAGISLGIVSAPALVYYADLRNQWGGTANTIAALAKNNVGTYDKITLYDLHQAALAHSSSYNDRRAITYNFALSLGWSETATVPTTPTITFPVTNGDLPGYSGQATYTNFWNLDTDGSSIDFHWTSDNATQYNYSVKKLTANPNPSSENEGIGVSCTELSQTSVRLPVEYGTWYKIGVCAINSAGESSWKIHYVRTRAQSPTVTSPTGLTSSSGYVSKTITAGESVTYAWNASQNVTNSYFHLIELSGTPDPASESEPYSKRIAAGETSYGSSGTYTYSEFEAGKWYKMTVETQNQNYTGIYTPTKWLINPVYIYAEAPTATSTINFDANGGSGAPSPITAAVGNTVTISATQPTRSGYTFLGWNYASNATVGSIQPGGRFTMLKIDVTLYAIWSENSVAVTGLTISDSSLTMKIGETKTITAAVSPANAANKAISWRCRGSAVTFDSETGLITAVAEGSATITATAEDGGFSASCTVTVESDAGQDLTGIAWRDYNNNDTITWEVDLSNEPRPYRLFYTTLPEGALYENITITYSNPIISASVNESANTISITPRSAGESIITLAVDGHEISINFIVRDTSAVSPLSGDVNGDSEIDFMDAYLILRYDAGLQTLTEEQQSAANVNNDGQVDFMDAYLVLRYDAGLINEF